MDFGKKLSERDEFMLVDLFRFKIDKYEEWKSTEEFLDFFKKKYKI